MEIVSLGAIIDDLLNIVRGAKVNVSEPISRRQVEAWIHEYRAKLIKQDLDKGKKPHTAYIQTIPAVKLIVEDLAGSLSKVTSDLNILRTEIKIPKDLDLNHSTGITFVGDLQGNAIQVVSESRFPYQAFRRYTNNDPLAFFRDGYVYVVNADGLAYLTIRGIFENPVDVYELANSVTNLQLFSYTEGYPIPITMIPTLKAMILEKELGITVQTPSDNIANSNSEFSSNLVK